MTLSVPESAVGPPGDRRALQKIMIFNLITFSPFLSYLKTILTVKPVLFLCMENDFFPSIINRDSFNEIVKEIRKKILIVF
jgi:hypothetical protein